MEKQETKTGTEDMLFGVIPCDKDKLSPMTHEEMEAEIEKMEAEHREIQKRDWLKFSCNPASIELSITSTDVNNFNGEFHTRSRCESQAREKLKDAYDEAVTLLDSERLYNTALADIMDFVEDRFRHETLRMELDRSKEKAELVKKYLDEEGFRQEISNKLRNITPGKLRSLQSYLAMIDYENNDEYEGGAVGEFLTGIIDRIGAKKWNYNGYEAYHQMMKDIKMIADRYAKEATKLARNSLATRVTMLEELKAAG